MSLEAVEVNAAAAAGEVRDLDPSGVRVAAHPVWGLIVQTEAGCWLRARAVRAFPLSAGDAEVALLSQKGEEIGTLPNLGGLDGASRAAIEAEFARRYVTAIIEGIEEIRAEGETLYWSVTTDRGPRDFVVKAGRETIISPGAGRLILVDVDGSRFEIPAVDRLSAASRRILDGVM